MFCHHDREGVVIEHSADWVIPLTKLQALLLNKQCSTERLSSRKGSTHWIMYRKCPNVILSVEELSNCSVAVQPSRPHVMPPPPPDTYYRNVDMILWNVQFGFRKYPKCVFSASFNTWQFFYTQFRWVCLISSPRKSYCRCLPGLKLYF